MTRQMTDIALSLSCHSAQRDSKQNLFFLLSLRSHACKGVRGNMYMNRRFDRWFLSPEEDLDLSLYTGGSVGCWFAK
jgi:hypothetical protein